MFVDVRGREVQFVDIILVLNQAARLLPLHFKSVNSTSEGFSSQTHVLNVSKPMRDFQYAAVEIQLNIIPF